jgi:hypothetical protein
MSTTATPLIEALRSQDGPALDGLLADDVAFHSPVADYSDREEITRLFVTIGGVVDDMRPRREIVEGAETIAFVDGEVDGRPLHGIIDVLHTDDGRVADVTLMLRPLDSLLVAVRKMGAALAR